MTTDIRLDSWILRYAPRRIEPYLRLMRLDRPVPIFLFLVPALWGLFGLRGITPPLSLLMIFSGGTLLMRSAGCILNDIIDRDLDPHVARTRHRPLASRELTVRQGFFCLSLVLVCALPLLLLLNVATIFMGIGLVILVSLYPFMKRLTYWPQVFLGITVNWGILMGSMALVERITGESFFLFLIGTLWTLFYDTIYAHQDKKDDILVGIKSTALKRTNKSFLRGIVGIIALCLAGYSWVFQAYELRPAAFILFISFLLGALGTLVYLIETTPLDQPSACLKAFKKAQVFGWLVLGALLVPQVG